MLEALDIFTVPHYHCQPDCLNEQISEILKSYQENGFDSPNAVALDIYQNCLEWLEPCEISLNFIADLGQILTQHWFVTHKRLYS